MASLLRGIAVDVHQLLLHVGLPFSQHAGTEITCCSGLWRQRRKHPAINVSPWRMRNCVFGVAVANVRGAYDVIHMKALFGVCIFDPPSMDESKTRRIPLIFDSPDSIAMVKDKAHTAHSCG